MSKRVAEKSLAPGDHGSTYGGNPLATAAVCEVLRQFEEKDLVGHVKELSPYMTEKLEELKAKNSHIKEVRGEGFMRGIELDMPAGDLVKDAQKEGLLVITAGSNIIRIVPPLVFEKKDIDEMCSVLEKVLDKIS